MKFFNYKYFSLLLVTTMGFMLMSFSNSSTSGHSSMGEAQAVSLSLTNNSAAPEKVAVTSLAKAAVKYARAAVKVTAEVVQELTKDPMIQEFLWTVAIAELDEFDTEENSIEEKKATLLASLD